MRTFASRKPLAKKPEAAIRPSKPSSRAQLSPQLQDAPQATLRVGAPGDRHEQEADRVADEVTRGEDTLRAATFASVPLFSPRSGGVPLPDATRARFEPRFGYDFRDVRVHHDERAQAAAARLGARAFTTGSDIYFNTGEFAPGTSEGDKLLAHELTHTVQQSQSGRAVVQRAVQLRPPGRGEATAFPRRQELVDRLNAQSPAIQYSLAPDGRTLQYRIVNAAAMTTFDHQMQDFIDNAATVPLRLITSAGLVRGATGAFEPLVHDEWISAYLDLDDLLASDNPGFQTQMVHILAERFATRNYERRIGSFPNTPASLREFDRAHNTAHDAEARTFQGMVGDPTIRFLYEEMRPNQTFVVAFRSNEGYRIFKVFRRTQRTVTGAEVFVQMPDRTRLTIDQLRARRTAAAPAAAPAP